MRGENQEKNTVQAAGPIIRLQPLLQRKRTKDGQIGIQRVDLMPESRREISRWDAGSRDHFHVRFWSLPVWQVNQGIESGAMLLSDIRSDADNG